MRSSQIHCGASIDQDGSLAAAIRRMQEAGVQLIESSAIDGRPVA
ncbi:hypothetical protein [Pseudomonas sp. SWRI179]|nr:hypothetical protein [Pseudomonas sp. SWRI179]